MVKTIIINNINRYISKDIQLNVKYTNDKVRNTVLDFYKTHKRNKSGCKTHFNFHVINNILEIKNEYKINSDNKCYIHIENDIEIPIRKQDYFHYNFINRLKKELPHYYDKNNFISEDFCNIENIRTIKCNDTKKTYRTDMELHVCENEYICIEFFEKAHHNFNDLDMIREKNRIYNILHDDNSEKKIVHFAIYWEDKLMDKKYLKKFVKLTIGKIKDYQNINDKKKWCIESINSYIQNYSFSEILYDCFQDKNKPLIHFNQLNSFIQWKNKKIEKKYFNDIYKKFIDQLESKKDTDIDDDDLDFLEEQNDDSKEKEIYYYDNKLTYHGLLFYLQLIPSEFLKDEINDKYNLMMFPNRITNGFIEGTEKH
jgi:hypothetical protein